MTEPTTVPTGSSDGSSAVAVQDGGDGGLPPGMLAALGQGPAYAELPDDWTSALCVAAHPDDLEYGVAAAVATWTDAGKRVTYAMVSSGEAGIGSMDPAVCGPLREQEELDGAALVGVDTVDFLGHADGVIEYGLPLRRDIARAIRTHRPDVVLTAGLDVRPPWGGVDHPDHRAVGLACVDAVRDAANRWVFTDQIAEGLPPWKVRYVLIGATERSTHAVPVGDTLDRGVASLQAHRKYLEGLGPAVPDVEQMLRGMARAFAPRFGGRPCVPVELLEI
nr:PIG-L deacetylase family protein [Nakamurella leprariae]